MTWTPGPAILTIGLLLPGILAGPAPAGEDVTPAPEKQPPVLDQELLRSAEKALGESRYEVALKQFERLAAEAPPDARVFLGLGRTQTALGDGAGAVLSLVDALNLAERDYDVLLALAEALLLQGRQAAWEEDWGTSEMALIDSRRMYEQATEVRPDRPEPWLGACRAARQQGDAEAALQFALAAEQADPAHVDTLLELGSLRFGVYWEILGMRGAEAAADARELCQRAYSRVLEIDSGNGYAMNGLGWIHMQAGETDQAIEWFAKSVEANPTLVDSYDNLAALLSGSSEERKRLVEILGNALRAAASFGSGAERQVTRAYVYYRRGMANSAARDAAAAARDLAEAARLDPNLALACDVERARALYRDNEYADAAELLVKLGESDFEQLLATLNTKASPRDEALMMRALADKMFRQNDLAAARDLFRLSAEILVTSADDWNNYAFFCRETRKYEESYAAYQHAIEIDPTNPCYLNDTALILHYHLHRDLEYAAELYGRAIEEAKRVLADEKADSFVRQAAQTALRDASNNLALLKSGKTRPGGGRRPNRGQNDR